MWPLLRRMATEGVIELVHGEGLARTEDLMAIFTEENDGKIDGSYAETLTDELAVLEGELAAVSEGFW